MAAIEEHLRVQRLTAPTLAALLRAGFTDMEGMIRAVNDMDVLELRYALAFLAGWWGDLVIAGFDAETRDAMLDKLAER